VHDGKPAIIYFKQADLAEWIFKEKKLPFVMGVTFSYKKHNAFRCIINYSNEEFCIRQEEKLIEIKKGEAKKLYKKIPIKSGLFFLIA
jgi:CRISPR type IV-associated protein Csf1